MRRDFDLIRKIILTVEDLPTGNVTDEIKIEDYTEEQIGYHNYLIVDSRLAKGVDMGGFGDASPNWQLIHLTSAGHDFAEAARNETSWNKAKGIIRENAGGVTLDILKEVLVGVVRGTLGLP